MHKLDQIDIAILHELSRDGRIGWRELAEKIGLSLTPTLRRVRRLEAEEYILGYSATLNDRQLGRAFHAILTITLDRQSSNACAAFEEEIVKIQEINFCAKLTGKPDYVANAMVEDTADYERMLSKVGRIEGVAKLQSNFLLKIVRARHPSLPGPK